MASVKAIYTALARRELGEALRYIAERNPKAAARLSLQLEETVARLAAREFEGRRYVFRSGRVVRTWPVGILRIYYERREDVLVIARIWHQARRPL